MARTRNFADVIRAKMAVNPDLAESVEIDSFNADVAMKVYEARKAAGLSQKQLAELVGTQQSVISRIEDADYDGHSLKLLRRIAAALGKKLQVEFYTCSTPLDTVQLETFSIDWESISIEWNANIGSLERTVLGSLAPGGTGVESNPPD